MVNKKCILCKKSLVDKNKLFCNRCRERSVFTRITAFRNTIYLKDLKKMSDRKNEK